MNIFMSMLRIYYSNSYEIDVNSLWSLTVMQLVEEKKNTMTVLLLLILLQQSVASSLEILFKNDCSTNDKNNKT